MDKKQFKALVTVISVIIVLEIAMLCKGLLKKEKPNNSGAVTPTVDATITGDDMANNPEATKPAGDNQEPSGNQGNDPAPTSEPGNDNPGGNNQGSNQGGNEPGGDTTPAPTKAPSGTASYGASHKVVGSATGSGYEGTKGTGKYNYGEALQKSLIFYELQRSGLLPETVRSNWRGDSSLNDGSDNGLDLTGGWYDAGDNVKFNLPMAYSAAVLAWSIYEDKDAYKNSKQLEYALGNVKWANDYFIKCHPEDEVYYYQVGDGNQDHGWWGPAELVETRMKRPSYKVTASAPGSAVTGEAAAALASCALIYKDVDKDYSALCLKHAKSLYAFSEKYKSDSGYTAANGFYNSWSGWEDELAWAGAWLYLATNDKSYLEKAEAAYTKAGHDKDWAMCWDDVHIGAALLLAQITGKDTYKKAIEEHLDWWCDSITTSPKGLKWLDSWGSLRYATTTAYIAAVYSESSMCPKAKVDKYWDFALSQANYALGDGGRSYMIGFGDNYPVNPHHRTAQGSYSDNMNDPNPGRHVLYGALVGGPDASDGYTDTVSNFNTNEVACDYNAGFTGLLAKLYTRYGGQTIKDFGAVEIVDEDEYVVEAAVNAQGNDFIEIKSMVYNMTGWPARVSNGLELRYFVDLSEVYEGGGSADKLEITTNYMQDAKADGLKVWDEAKHIYYLSVKYSDNALYPGGQQHYKKETQVRIRNANGSWDNSNDPSFDGLVTGQLKKTVKTCLYENGKLVYGVEP